MGNINTQGFGIQLAPAGFSLEANKIFDDYSAALEFVKTKPAAYVGSIITVLAPSTIDGTTYPKGAYTVDAVGENAVLTQIGNVNDLVDAGEFIELQNRVDDLDLRLVLNDTFATNIGNATELLSRLSVTSPKVLVTTSLEGSFTVRLSEQISPTEIVSVSIEKDNNFYTVMEGSANVPLAYGKNTMYLVVTISKGNQRYAIKKPFSIVVLPSIALGVSTDKETLPTSDKTTSGYPYDDSYHVHEVTFDESLTMETDGHLCVILPTAGGYDSLLSVSIAGHNVPMETTNKMEVNGLMSFVYHSVDKLKKGTYDNIVLTVQDNVM